MKGDGRVAHVYGTKGGIRPGTMKFYDQRCAVIWQHEAEMILAIVGTGKLKTRWSISFPFWGPIHCVAIFKGGKGRYWFEFS